MTQIYVANEDNTVSIINEDTNTVTSTISVGALPTFIGINSVTNKIYVSNTGNQTISVLDGRSNVKLLTIPLSADPNTIMPNPNTNIPFLQTVRLVPLHVATHLIMT